MPDCGLRPKNIQANIVLSEFCPAPLQKVTMRRVALGKLIMFRSAAIACLALLAASPAWAQAQAPSDLFDGQALRVILCGTSGPLPDPGRAKSCTLIIAGDEAYVVDTGPESWEQIARMGIPGTRISGIFLTHFHSDHIGDLGEFRMQTMVAGRNQKLKVFGPKGIKSVVDGFNQAYREDARHRLAHHGADIINLKAADLEARPIGAGFRGELSAEQVVFEKDGLKVTAFEVDHDPVRPAVGYRFDWNGRSAVVTGDTALASNLTENARKADVLVSDTLAANMIGQAQKAAASGGNARNAKILADIPDYHLSPAEAAKTANDAGVGLLVFSHLVPSAQARSPLFLAGVEDIRPGSGWVLGFDGLRIDLPTGGEEIRQSALLPKP